jgi:hypothetical protein
MGRQQSRSRQKIQTTQIVLAAARLRRGSPVEETRGHNPELIGPAPPLSYVRGAFNESGGHASRIMWRSGEHSLPPGFQSGGVSLGVVTILPGDAAGNVQQVGIQLRPNPSSGSIDDDCEMFLGAKIGFRLATEVSPGEDKRVILSSKLSPHALRTYFGSLGLVNDKGELVS